MLVNLTPIQSEIDRCKKIAEENDFEYSPQSDPKWLQETGIYQDSIAFNFLDDEFVETTERLSWEDKYMCVSPKGTYGVADNIEQIKEYYKEEIEDPDRKFFIRITPVWQDKENKGNGGGWRWHKWGKYIGILSPQCEYLDDEDFGEDFEYVLTYTIQLVK